MENVIVLMVAADKGSVELLTSLISAVPKTNVQDVDGFSALIYAIRQNRTKTALAILELGANANLSSRDSRGLVDRIKGSKLVWNGGTTEAQRVSCLTAIKVVDSCHEGTDGVRFSAMPMTRKRGGKLDLTPPLWDFCGTTASKPAKTAAKEQEQ